jgi:hypothetical protein
MGGGLWGAPFGVRPLGFEENRGQTDAQVKFLARGDGYGLFLTPAEAVLALKDGPPLRLRWEGARSAPRVSGERELPGRSHYLIGNDPARWRQGIPSYERVLYREIYPGVDLVFYGNGRQLEHDFVLAPGADPGKVRLAVEGADGMEIDGAGDLVLHLGSHLGSREVRLKRPVAYQEIGGVRREVASGWRRIGGVRLGFEVGERDPARPLVIDPVLVYSTYLGGSSLEEGHAIAVDPAGNAYVTGFTYSSDFPTRGSIPPSSNPYDAFVTKLSPAGALVYSTYLGGRFSIESGHGIAVDASGYAYVTGYTASPDFPLVNPLPPPQRGTGGNAFVAKLSPGGSALVYSTTLGGADLDEARAIGIDSQGGAYVAGVTYSPDFPRVNPLLHPQSLGSADAFVARLSPSGSALVYSTPLGGSSRDEANGIAVYGGGNAYVVGGTASPDFPTIDGFQETFQGGPPTLESDAFVAHIDPTGAFLIFSTYLGGHDFDTALGVATFGGLPYVTGITYSRDFPTVRALQSAAKVPPDAFLTILLWEDGVPIVSTYLGGSSGEEGRAVAVDPSGAIYLTGVTESPDFPVKDAFQARCAPLTSPIHCTQDVFVTKLAPMASGLVYSSFLGGSRGAVTGLGERGFGIVAGPTGDAYVTGWTTSLDFPTVNSFQPRPAGGSFDAFVTRIGEDRPPVCTAAFASPASLWPPNGQLVSVAIRGVTDPDGDPVAITVTAVRQDEPLGKPGAPDALGIGTPSVQLRADRNGGGDGRVYQMTFTATDPQGASCTGRVTVCVPHDQGRGTTCGDGGGLFDSTGRGR